MSIKMARTTVNRARTRARKGLLGKTMDNSDTARFTSWRKSNLKLTDGFIVGADSKQEWLLPWWWNNCRKYNNHEVVFVDFGMSSSAKEWCAARGEVIPLSFPEGVAAAKESIPQASITLWERLYSANRLWSSRSAWFKKPAALLLTPFQRTLWTDLDCEIKQPLDSLFKNCRDYEIGLVREPPYPPEKQSDLDKVLPAGTQVYNTGVILYPHGSNIVQKWAEAIFTQTSAFPGNQFLLAYLLRENKSSICELPAIYNWRMRFGPNPEAAIIHWVSDGGKEHIRRQILG